MPARPSGWHALASRIWMPKDSEFWAGGQKHVTWGEISATYARALFTGQLRSDGGLADEAIYAPNGNIRGNQTVYNPSGPVGGQRFYQPNQQDQAITAAGNQITPRRIVTLNPDAAYTLTSTPTIAAGLEGELVTLVRRGAAASNITLQDETGLAGSKLRMAGAAAYVMGTRDSITFVYSGIFAEWIEIARSNN